MANPEHLKILKQGVEAWNKWRRENPSIDPDLNGADLRGADLRMADLTAAHLNGVDLSQALLGRADLIAADLSMADLTGTYLWLTIFLSANIEGVNLTDSMMQGTIFSNVDLSLAKGLETVKHHGGSSIDFYTIQRSKGEIPDAFMRGAGVSDDLIAFIRAMGGAIQFYSCFISYASKDQLFAERIYEGLQARGVRCWFAPHDAQGGKKLHEQIDDAIGYMNGCC